MLQRAFDSNAMLNSNTGVGREHKAEKSLIVFSNHHLPVLPVID